MNIPAFLFFLILFGCELFAMYDIISSSEKKGLSIFLSLLGLVVSFSLGYFLSTFKGIWDIAGRGVSIFAIAFLLLFIVGHICMAINEKMGEMIANVFHTICLVIILISFPIVSPILFFFSIGVLK